MVDLSGFNANEVEPSQDFTPIPAGEYLAAVTASEMKDTKANDGSQYLELTFQILDGEYKNRNLWARLNLKNKSDVAMKIAEGELSAICRAVGVMIPKDSNDLHNLPLILKVSQKKRTDNGELTNEIKGYKKKDGAAASSGGGEQQAAASTPPWMRK